MNTFQEKKNFDYRLILLQILQQRRTVNSEYSLRTMAKELLLDFSHLSRLVNFKRHLSVGRAMDISEILFQNESQKNSFIQLVKLKSSSVPTESLEKYWEQFKEIMNSSVITQDPTAEISAAPIFDEAILAHNTKQ